MITQSSLAELYKRPDVPELIPHAIINESFENLSRRFHFTVEEDTDDLDHYVGTGLIVDNNPVALKHYRGYPENTITVYFSALEMNIERITKLIRIVLKNLDLPEKSLHWERRSNPDL
jgi:hypothetical protein